ncbi:hypothetical protein TSUD_182680 [Trifolium subterraneum]|uniref:Uncharacterized protein n=1 Tax=Trifolium subterraneum TaxID=3900 RepID=A0A2Z6LGP0_TRISU|nr:hypothetical protein TSUD_182680 [Trifolium subterraneum]
MRNVMEEFDLGRKLHLLHTFLLVGLEIVEDHKVTMLLHVHLGLVLVLDGSVFLGHCLSPSNKGTVFVWILECLVSGKVGCGK